MSPDETSLRDDIALAVMTHLLPEARELVLLSSNPIAASDGMPARVAAVAYIYADAMLAERAK